MFARSLKKLEMLLNVELKSGLFLMWGNDMFRDFAEVEIENKCLLHHERVSCALFYSDLSIYI